MFIFNHSPNIHVYIINYIKNGIILTNELCVTVIYIGGFFFFYFFFQSCIVNRNSKIIIDDILLRWWRKKIYMTLTFLFLFFFFFLSLIAINYELSKTVAGTNARVPRPSSRWNSYLISLNNEQQNIDDYDLWIICKLFLTIMSIYNVSIRH